MNVIGDVAGQYETLLALIKDMPEDDTILVGDLVDRGPDSHKVIDHVIDNDNIFALLGNHEHMMVDFYKKLGYYDRGIWLMNGGRETIKGYGLKPGKNPEWSKNAKIMRHVDFLSTLPWIFEYIEPSDGTRYIFTHAPIRGGSNVDELLKTKIDKRSFGLIWNRSLRVLEKPGITNIFGHNSSWGLMQFKRKDGTNSAICIDTSENDILTGYSTKTKQFYSKKYIK